MAELACSGGHTADDGGRERVEVASEITQVEVEGRLGSWKWCWWKSHDGDGGVGVGKAKTAAANWVAKGGERTWRERRCWWW